MSAPHASASAVIPAPAADVYAIIADYREGHPRIVPRPPFVSLEVLEGGFGAGTVIRVAMKVGGSTQTFRAEVTEPEPGRVLVEESDTGFVTSFTVDPIAGGREARVTISTEITGKGLAAAIQRHLAPRLLEPVYRRELALLAEVAAANG